MYRAMVTTGSDKRHQHHLHIAGRRITLPRGRSGRIALGIGLVFGGTLGFLPVLGFWMLPLGLIVLSRDVPVARRVYRACRYQTIKFRRRHTRGNDVGGVV